MVCFIDDDLSKKGRRIHNVPVVGGKNEILQQAEKYHVDEIYIALPSIDDKEVWIVYLKSNHHNHQLANTIKITDPKSLEEFVQFFDTYKYLDKKTGYSSEKVMSWIYKE